MMILSKISRQTLKPMSLLRSRLGLTHLSKQVIGSQSPGEIPMSSRSASHEPSRLTPTKTAVIFWICLNPSEAKRILFLLRLPMSAVTKSWRLRF